MFLFSLAEHLHMPVGELLKRMDSRELSEWMAYFMLKNKSSRQDRQSGNAEALKRQAKSDLGKTLNGR